MQKEHLSIEFVTSVDRQNSGSPRTYALGERPDQRTWSKKAFHVTLAPHLKDSGSEESKALCPDERGLPWLRQLRSLANGGKPAAVRLGLS
jgi:hypothetical protein